MAMLCYLSMSERAVSRETLAALFWSEFDRIRAPANLRRTLYSLGKALGNRYFITDREALGFLEEGTLQTDARVFKKIVRQAKAQNHELESGDTRFKELLRQAVTIYRGDFLEGFNLNDSLVFEDWQLIQRDELSSEYAWSIDRLAEMESMTGNWEAAIELMKRRVALDPIDDKSNRTLMQYYAFAGRRNAAIQHYAHYERVLRDEIGQPPPRDAGELLKAIREGTITAEQKTQSARGPETKTVAIGSPRLSVEPLLETKLFRPPMIGAYIKRLRLQKALDEAVKNKVTLVSAPPGFGKSSLIADWAGTSRRPVAWVSLDKDDNDPIRFLGYVIAALAKIRPEIAEGTATLGLSPQTSSPRSIITILIDEIQKKDEEFVLVLDDLQFITESSVNQGLLFLLEHMPPQLHVILATRSDPALPMARLRAQGCLEEIRSEDLRFTAEEAELFFREAMGLSLEREQVSLLEDRTEGWIAGLKMAALSLRGREDRSSMILAFGGSNRFVFDYLIEEVYANLDVETLDFLLPCSILERISAPLCEAVVEKSGGEAFIRSLERSNLFIIPLDEERRWYRLHHLFADLVKHKLATARSEREVQEYHIRAATWLSSHGSIEETMSHLLAARDFSKAGALIIKETQRLTLAGRYGEILSWINAFPPEVVSLWPELSFQKGQALTFAGRISELSPIIKDMEKGLLAILDDERRRSVQVAVSLVHALEQFLRGDILSALPSALNADELVNEKDQLFHGALYWILLTIYRALGKWDAASTSARKYMDMTRDTGDTWAFANGSTEYIYILRSRGRVKEAVSLCREILTLAESRGEGKLVWLARIYYLLAELERFQGDFVSARLHIKEAEIRAERWGSLSDLSNCHIIRAAIATTMGDYKVAANRLDKASEELASGETIPGITGALAIGKARLIFATSDTQEAYRWLEMDTSDLAISIDIRIALQCARFRLQRLVSDSYSSTEAVDILAGDAKECRDTGRYGKLPELYCLLAAERSIQGNKASSIEELERALQICEVEGIVTPFLEEGGAMRSLIDSWLAEAPPDSSFRRFAERIAAAFSANFNSIE